MGFWDYIMRHAIHSQKKIVPKTLRHPVKVPFVTDLLSEEIQLFRGKLDGPRFIMSDWITLLPCSHPRPETLPEAFKDRFNKWPVRM